jgi:hypothetical protein
MKNNGKEQGLKIKFTGKLSFKNYMKKKYRLMLSMENNKLKPRKLSRKLH